MFAEGQEGNNITWFPWDDYPGSYEILVNGTLLRSGTWNLISEAIVAVVDGLAIGDYNYTLVVYDVRGNSASDEVMVKVQSARIRFDNGLVDPLLYLSLVAGVVIVGIVIVVLRRR